MKTISLYKGRERYTNILKALELIKPQIQEKIKNKKNIIIKPNCVSDQIQLASTHADTLRAVLDFLTKTLNYKNKITIAEGSAYDTKTAFKNFDYLQLKKHHGLEFKDLNQDDFKEIQIYNREGRPIKVGISKTLLNSDCIISLALLKTHDSVLATFSIKNIAVGSLIKKSLFQYGISPILVRKVINRLISIRNDKAKIHQGPKAINKNIFEIYKIVKPDISVIDGFKAMQGNGPIDGTPVKMNLALASTSAIALDAVASQLIGLNPQDIGYLYYIMNYENFNPNSVKIIGNTTINKEKKKFKLHDTAEYQKKWR